MTRIGTFQQQQTLVTEMLRSQERLATTQRQVSTGRKAERFSDLNRDASALLGAKSLQSRVQVFIETNTIVKLRLDANDLALRGLQDSADALRDSVNGALATNSGLEFATTVELLLDQAVGILNTKIDGKHIFGGTNTEEPPVNITGVADLLALAEPPTGAFENNQTIPSAQVDESVTIEFGVLADAVGQDFLLAVQRILSFENGTLPAGAGAFAPAGPFSDPLTDNQRQFLTGELAALQAVEQDLTTATAVNGTKFGQIEEITLRQEQQLIFTAEFVSELEDVDIAEAVSRLTQDELALQTAMAVVSRVSRLSLLDFL